MMISEFEAVVIATIGLYFAIYLGIKFNDGKWEVSKEVVK